MIGKYFYETLGFELVNECAGAKLEELVQKVYSAVTKLLRDCGLEEKFLGSKACAPTSYDF